MVEAIRLVIWDLDETFWSGTLTEGGISYSQPNHDIVTELARRGIMSSICSKNDLEPVKNILQQKGIWDYFIFPSITWDPKGPRLAELINAVQLRPETVLFIDDNPMNLNEAKYYVPGLQVSNESIIPEILSNPLFEGKDDFNLSRLKQYKVLEEKHDARLSATDTISFLRQSGIVVTIEHDLTSHIDRIIELINRTNQLNFTKNRLPEDTDEAKLELRSQLNGFTKHAGIIHVKDSYGDYGYVGFYLIDSYGRNKRLEHFCFSCRTLGMGVEAWVYDQLGRPNLRVVGEILTDLESHPKVDWINRKNFDKKTNENIVSKVFIRGGCATTSLAHYLSKISKEVVGEFNYVRDNAGIRLDHSRFLYHALCGISGDEMRLAKKFGYDDSDFKSDLIDPEMFDVVILNFGVDGLYATYSQDVSGFRLPFPQCHSNMVADIRKVKADDDRSLIKSALTTVNDLGLKYHIPEVELFSRDVNEIIKKIPQTAALFLLLGPETYTDENGFKKLLPMHKPFNNALIQICKERKNTYALQPTDFVERPEDRIDHQHFGRMVYYRMSQKISAVLSSLDHLKVLDLQV